MREDLQKLIDNVDELHVKECTLRVRQDQKKIALVVIAKYLDSDIEFTDKEKEALETTIKAIVSKPTVI